MISNTQSVDIDFKLLDAIKETKEPAFFKIPPNKFALKEFVTNVKWLDQAIEICRSKKENNQVLFLKTIKFRTLNDINTIYEHGNVVNGKETKDKLRLYPKKVGSLVGGPAYLKREIRNFIYRDFIEIDMINSHWNLFCIYCLNHNLNQENWILCKEFTNNRERILDELNMYDGMSRQEAKTLLLQVLYGGGFPSSLSHKKYLKALQDEIKFIMQETNCKSFTYLSARLQQLEVNLIKNLMEKLNGICERICYVYDGILVYSENENKIKDHLDIWIHSQEKNIRPFLKFKFSLPIKNN